MSTRRKKTTKTAPKKGTKTAPKKTGKKATKTKGKTKTKAKTKSSSDLFSSDSDSAAGESIETVEFREALSERYLTYALSTIMSRSLPDARDGLKPVHRRLLYSMHRMGLRPDASFRKSARVVGNVMGRFHPHGEASIYDALVRMSQDFSLRWPLAEGQGNFGSIDGDPAAAMRYTEVRMSAMALRLLDGIDEDAVDFRPSYDDSETEPVLLPGGFPSLLANGAQGIAVGMSCSVPPHNLEELCRALLCLLKSPNARHATLMSFIPGPDFPTGGELAEDADTISEVYREGRGQLRLRARWRREEVSRGRWQVVVYEVPYQTAKSRLVARLSEFAESRGGGLLRAVHDESDESVRVVLVPGDYDTDAAALMERLYRRSDLEVKVPVHLNALDADGAPRTFSLKGLLEVYLSHRFEVLRRCTGFRLERAELRLELVEGFLRLFDNFEAAIRIIRGEDDPAAVLAKRFKLNDRQVQAVLDLRLRALRKLEEARLREERESLLDERRGYRRLLREEGLQREAIAAEVKGLMSALGVKTEFGARRTLIGAAPADVESDASAGEGGAVTLPAPGGELAGVVVISRKDWVRFVRGGAGGAGGAGDVDVSSLRFRDGDGPAFSVGGGEFFGVLGSDGRCYVLESGKLPGSRGYGEPLRMLINLGEEVRVVGVVSLYSGGRVLVAASDGRGFIVRHESLWGRTRGGVQVMTLPEGVEAVSLVDLAEGDEMAGCLSSGGKLLLFGLGEIPERARGRGVILQRLRGGEVLEGVFGMGEGGVFPWSSRGCDISRWVGKRAQTGRKAPRPATLKKSN
ncbi:MAG: DNA topoisomerase 4 subunit A [Alphaproteobacteria bacterium]|nr:DNA topoisomerase 4 subunit A [Alphaproteobacteria bacterium]